MRVSKLTTRATLLDVGCLFSVLSSSKFNVVFHMSSEYIRHANTIGVNVLLVDKSLIKETVSS